MDTCFAQEHEFVSAIVDATVDALIEERMTVVRSVVDGRAEPEHEVGVEVVDAAGDGHIPGRMKGFPPARRKPAEAWRFLQKPWRL